jgi:hypothetical protein
MAQLRQDYQEFVRREAELVVVGPEGRSAFEQYWRKEFRNLFSTRMCKTVYPDPFIALTLFEIQVRKQNV